jgi:uncharacterized surface protein with fasciclin (FAS1) repeats
VFMGYVSMVCHGHIAGPEHGALRNAADLSSPRTVVVNHMRKSFGSLVGGLLLALGVAACSSSSPVAPASVSATAESAADTALDSKPGAATGAKPGALTVVGIVLQDDGEFDVLQSAVVRAGLVDALNGTAQYTVFAPTDAAFVATLGVADEAAALAAVNGLPLDALKNILLYHVTHGRRNSASVMGAPGYQMLNGATLTRESLTAAGLATTDISASNGIVHVINAVLMP